MKKQTLAILFTFLSFLAAFGQCTLVCNDQINLSLNTAGYAIVEYDMLLEGDYTSCNAENFDITLEEPDGTIITDRVVNRSHDGDTLNYTVTDPQTGVSCWGRLVIEDKLSLDCTDTLNIDIQTQMGSDDIIVSFVVENFNAIASFQFSINYNPNLLVFEELASTQLPAFNAQSLNESESGKIRTSWFDPTALSTSLPNGSSMFDLRFTKIGDGENYFSITDDPLVIEFTNDLASYVCLNAYPESVTVEADSEECLLTCIQQLNANLNAQGEIEIFIEDFLFGNYDNCLVNEFELEVFDNNTLVTGGTSSVNIENPGVYDYIITDPNTSNTCSGILNIEDPFSNCTLACNGIVNVALSNQSNNALVYVESLLEGNYTNCDVQSFVITVEQNGNLIVESTGSVLLDQEGIFDYTITDPSTQNSCFGQLEVVDFSGPCILVCNSEINLSLNPNLVAEVTMDMILQAFIGGCDDQNLQLSIEDQNGNVISPPVLNATHIGQDIYAIVTDPSSGNSCWTLINVEDKACTLNCINLSTAVLPDFGPVEIFAQDLVLNLNNCDYSGLIIEVEDQLGIVYGGSASVSIQNAGLYEVTLTNTFTGDQCITSLRVLGESTTCADTMQFDLVAEEVGGEVVLNILTTNFNQIQTAQFSIEYDHEALGFMEVSSALPGFTNSNFNANIPGKIGFVWLDQTGLNPHTNPDGESILTISFAPIDQKNVRFGIINDPVSIEFTNINSELVCLSSEAIFTDVDGEPEPCNLACNDNINVNILVNNLIEVTPQMVLEGNTELCGAFEVDVLDATGSVIASSPFINFSTSGESYDYVVTQTSTGNSCWGTITAVEPTVIQDDCVDSLFIDLVSQFDGEKIRLDLKAYNFNEIVGFQFAIKYDPNVLEFERLIDSPLPGLVDGSSMNDINGDLLVLWSDPSVSSISLVDGSTIMSLEFKALQNANTNFSIGETNNFKVEIINSNLELICLEYISNEVIIDGAHYYGYIRFDENLNCEVDNTDRGLRDWFITLEDGVNEFNFDTDDQGYYSMVVPAGSYTITAHAPNDLWTFCENNVLAETMSNDEFYDYDFLATPNEDCPYLTVDLSAPLLRRCFDNKYYINYSNKGTLDAEDAYIDVVLDDYLIFVGSEHDDYQVNGQELRFNVGDLSIGGGGRIVFTVNVSCDSELGQTHCTEASIFPQPDCLGEFANWNGPTVTVEGICTEDEVEFKIANIGEPMQGPSSFIVIEDDVMTPKQDFQLTSNEEISVAYPRNGSTYRIVAYQVDGHPSMNIPTVALEGCGFDSQGDFTTGFVNMFENGDAEENIDIDCQENIGSFDPNDKQAFPKGYREENMITNENILEYKLRFQNTGTDTAFRVVIKDTLSNYLDLPSIQLGTSSHPYVFSLEDSRVLVFTFDDIKLLSEKENEPASHGFVKYKILQEPGNVDGTRILNKADIYFDFNEPIVTNETNHLIGSDFVETLVSTINIEDPNLQLKFYPNPFVDKAILKLEHIDLKDSNLEVYNLIGSRVKSIQINALETELDLSNLSSGNYFFRLNNNNNLIATGKLIRQ